MTRISSISRNFRSKISSAISPYAIVMHYWSETFMRYKKGHVSTVFRTESTNSRMIALRISVSSLINSLHPFNHQSLAKV